MKKRSLNEMAGNGLSEGPSFPVSSLVHLTTWAAPTLWRFALLVWSRVNEENAMHFVKESRIGASPSVVFAFHERPGALERLTPPWETVDLVEGGGSIRPGSRVILRTKLGPFSLRWVAEHTEYDPPHLFADRQVSGPFASWYHRHRFLDDGSGGTRLRDEVEYEPPMGWLGRKLSARFLREKLEKLFEFRHETTRRIVESGDFPG